MARGDCAKGSAEELSLLAGVSVAYYTRLEQGHDRRPSASVLDALGEALGLTDDA